MDDDKYDTITSVIWCIAGLCGIVYAIGIVLKGVAGG